MGGSKALRVCACVSGDVREQLLCVRFGQRSGCDMQDQQSVRICSFSPLSIALCAHVFVIASKMSYKIKWHANEDVGTLNEAIYAKREEIAEKNEASI